MMIKIKKTLAVFTALMLALAILGGCSNKTNRDVDQIEKGSSAQASQTAVQTAAEKHIVMASFYPIYGFVLNICENIEEIEVELLTEPQIGCLHDYQLTTADMKKLEKAEVLVINGLGMESFLSKIMDQKTDMRIIDSSATVQNLIQESDESDGHDHEYNQHIWTNTDNAVEQINGITAGLVLQYPQFAEQLKINAQTYIEKIIQLKAQMNKLLQSDQNMKVVAFHDGFSYLAQEFAIDVVGTIQKGEHEEPTAQEVAALIQTMNDQGVRIIFTEPQYPAELADTIAHESGAVAIELNLVLGGDSIEAKNAYTDNMLQNAKMIHEALR